MEIWLWIGFIVFVLIALALDLGIFNRRPHVVSTREALFWTAIWVACALVFNVLVYFIYQYDWLGFGESLGGRQASLEFLAGYVLEKSLSLDNIFVIAVIFAHFRVPAQYQHRVLFWGILGALVMRGLMIGVGVALINQFEWMIQVFGVILLITAVRIIIVGDEPTDPSKSFAVRLARRVIPITPDYHDKHFFVKVGGKLAATPLFLALLVIETVDLMFAVDSIPAVFAVTRDPFLVFTSNVFAILGLRALYFALAGLIRDFRFLGVALMLVLAFVGVKMLLTPWVHLHVLISLGVIVTIVTAGVVASMVWPKIDDDDKPELETPHEIPVAQPMDEDDA